MAVDIKRKQNETAEAMIRRFSRKVLQSGIIYQAKANRFRQPKKNKRQKREAAKRRRYIVARRDYLIKVGKLEERDTAGSQWSTMYRTTYTKKK